MLGVGYAFISAYLKGEEAKMITSSHVDSMSKASSIQEVLEIIRDTDIGNYLAGVSVQTFDELDEDLWIYFGGCLRQVEWFKNLPASIHKLLDTYIIKYDILNIKAVLESISTGKKTQSIPIGTIHSHGLLDEFFSAEELDVITGLLNRCKLGNYASILEEYKVDEGVRSRLITEAKLDGEYYRKLLSVTGRIKDGSTLSRAFSTIKDMTNLQIIIRAVIGGIDSEVAEYAISGGYMISEALVKDLISVKLADIPGRLENAEYRGVVEEIINSYDRSKSWTTVGEVIEKHKFRLIKEVLSPRVLSPLVLIWYLILKEIEIRNLRLILKATFDSISIEEIDYYLVLSS